MKIELIVFKIILISLAPIRLNLYREMEFAFHVNKNP